MVGMSKQMVNRYCRFSKQRENALAAVHYLRQNEAGTPRKAGGSQRQRRIEDSNLVPDLSPGASQICRWEACGKQLTAAAEISGRLGAGSPAASAVVVNYAATISSPPSLGDSSNSKSCSMRLAARAAKSLPSRRSMSLSTAATASS